MDESRQPRVAVPASWWRNALVGLLAVAALPVVASWWRGDRGPRCLLDGQTIDPQYQVTIMQSGRSREFCCLTCGELWMERTGAPAESILVTDEVSGEPIRPEQAYFVRSRVEVNAPTRERRHVFKQKSDANAHIDGHNGRLLLGRLRPFAAWRSAAQ